MADKTSSDPASALSGIQRLIERETFLKMSVIDVQLYDNTLVVMTDHAVPRMFVRALLKQQWHGPIEVYCATALMAGNQADLG